MKAIVALALSAAVPAPAAPPVATPVAETAARTVNLIAAGRDMGGPDGVPSLTQPELSELKKLAGCRPSVVPGGDSWGLTFNWLCSAPVEGVDARQTELCFKADGSLADITVNPVAARFAPTPMGLAAQKLESRAGVAKRFAKAIRDGVDPTLGGLVPLTPLQRVQIAPLVGTEFRIVEFPSKSEIYISWNDKKVGGVTTEIHFDKDRRPIGMMFIKFIKPMFRTTFEPV